MLNYIQKGRGETIVLLHGIAGSARYWDDITCELAKTYKVIAVDLLGFGRSPKPRLDYSMDDHSQAVISTLKSLKINQPYTLVGHSMGAMIALNLAVEYPEKINKLVLLNLPLYDDPAQAKADITKSKLKFRLAYYGPSSWLMCNIWCRLLRPVSRRAARFYLAKFSKNVAEDSVLHSWRSFSRSLENIIVQQNSNNQLKKVKVQTYLVGGNQDNPFRVKNFKKLRNLPPNIKKISLPGDHNLPLQKPGEISQIISS